jgi:hypothetical protein
MELKRKELEEFKILLGMGKLKVKEENAIGGYAVT